MALVVVLSCVAIMLATSVLAIGTARSAPGRFLVYGVSLTTSVISLGAGLSLLLGRSAASALTLPFGLPWLGAHFAIDTLSAFS